MPSRPCDTLFVGADDHIGPTHKARAHPFGCALFETAEQAERNKDLLRKSGV